MARRIKFEGFMPYMTGRIRVAGYRPTEKSRFAVARIDRNQNYQLIHVRSGMPVESVLPALPRTIVMQEKLAIAAGFETLTHCDFSAFDALPELGPNSNAKAALDPSSPGIAATVQAMRELAAQALA